MSARTRRHCLVAGAVLVIMVAYAGQIKGAAGRASSDAFKLSAQEVEMRAARVGALLVRDPGALTIRVDRPQADVLNATWRASVTGPKGDRIALLAWDAHTGELVSAACAHGLVPRAAGDVNVREAVDIAWNWLEQLGVAELEPEWRLARRPLRRGDLWEAKFSSGVHRAFVIVHARTGRVVQVLASRATTAYVA